MDEDKMARMNMVFSRDAESIGSLRNVPLAWMGYSAVSRNPQMIFTVLGSMRILCTIDKLMHARCVLLDMFYSLLLLFSRYGCTLGDGNPVQKM